MNAALNNFVPISLLQMQRVTLLDRVELKYTIPIAALSAYLQQLTETHSILEMDGCREFGYTTHYYDAPAFTLYLDHHNGYANRIKVRRRLYSHTGDCFFEVKRKVNGNRTEKTRISIPSLESPITPAEKALIQYPHLRDRVPEFKLNNTFTRITLCDKLFTERITIDTNISMNVGGDIKHIAGVALIEIKQNSHAVQSQAIRPLRAMGVHSGPFSKYALGVAYLYPQLKHNNFKPVMLNLDKYAR